MQVFNFKDQRALLAPFETHLSEGVESPRSDRFGSQYSDGCGSVLDVQELEQIRRGCLHIDAHFLQSKSYFLRDCFRAIGLDDATVMAQYIKSRMIGHHAAIGETASFEIGDLLML